MPRGGKRERAGRKSKIDPLTIALAAETRLSAAMEVALAAAIRRRTETYQIEIDKLKKIPVKERPRWIRSARFQDHLDDVEFARQTDQGLGDLEKSSQLLRIRETLPKGVVLEIEREVALVWDVSLRTVQRCRKWYRDVFVPASDEDPNASE